MELLFFPGGPGIGSESLQELADVADCPGTSWLVDLPGDGSNVAAPGAPADPYPRWPQVLLEAVDAVPHASAPVVISHRLRGSGWLSFSSAATARTRAPPSRTGRTRCPPNSVPFVVEGYQLTGTANVNAAGLTIDPAASLPANTYPLTYSVAPEPTTALADVHRAAVVSRQGYGGEVIGLFRRLLRRLGLDRRAAPRRATRHRAAAVVISGERLLVIKRHKRGRDYAVLPGGGVEHGETAAQAALRELQEETSLTAEIDRPLWTGMHNDRPASYFLMTAVRGRAELSGPEARANRPDNSFELHWVTAGQFAEYGLFPHDIRGALAELLAVDPNPATDQADTPRSPTS